MPRLRPFLKGRGHRLEFVVGVMKVTNGRKGDAPRRECTAPRPRRGPRGGEALAGVRRRARVRVQGAGQRDERADGLRGPADVRREPQRAQRRQGEQPQRLPPQALKTAVGDVELEIPELRHGTYYPEGMLARWSRVDTSVAAIVQEMYVCGVSTRKVERVASKLAYPRCRARRSRASAPTSTRGGGVPPPRPVGHAVLLPVARRTYMSCRVGSSVVSQAS